MTGVSGLHHLTAIAGDAQRNYDFYAGVLGLRLVKHTVNFDDPGSLHLYYGDGVGTPGTLLTFFPWQRGSVGLRGVHQVGSFSLAVPLEALGFWIERLIEKGIRFKGPHQVAVIGAGTSGRAQSLEFSDPDGIDIALIASASDQTPAETWKDAAVPTEYAVRGIYSVQLWVLKSRATIELLEMLGYETLATQGNLTTLGVVDSAEAADTTETADTADATVPDDVVGPATGRGLIEVRETGQFLSGREGVGTVHHLALSVADDDDLARLGAAVVTRGLAATEVRERQYFRSRYFREPGGVLLELATAGPGFLVDEAAEELGATLKLPPQYERLRSRLELTLPQVDTTV